MAEVSGERALAERDLADARPAVPFTAEEVRAMVLALKDIAGALAEADPTLEAEV